MKKDFFSFVIIPPNSSQSLCFRLPKWAFHLIVASSLIFIVVIGITIYVAVENTTELTHYKKLKKEAVQQRIEYSQLNQDLDELKEEIIGIIDKEEEIQSLLGDAKSRKRRYRGSKKKGRRRAQKKKSKSQHFKAQYKKSNDKDLPIEQSMTKKILLYQEMVQGTKTAIASLHQKAYQYKARFASTPSIRPVYGRILSTFGWRTHPITGKHRKHKGIDIATWRGAPIHAAADGIIEYAGWSGTFGYVIVMDHEFGYRTIYAHCSQIIARKNELVKKGQVIAQVGSTGLSTGPHLHFEIRKWRKAISPMPYLDLDMFTASTRIW